MLEPQALALILLVIKSPGRLDEAMHGIFFIQPQGPRVGSHEASRKDLIRKFGKISLFQRFHEIRADAGLRRHVIDRQPFGLTDLFEKFAYGFHRCSAYYFSRSSNFPASAAYSPPLSKLVTRVSASRALVSYPSR